MEGGERRGEESRAAGGKMKYKSSSEKAGEQGLGCTCVEDTNASYTNFNLSLFPLRPPSESSGLESPCGQKRNI